MNTLHFSSSTTTNAFPKSTFSPPSRPRNLHFPPSFVSTSTTTTTKTSIAPTIYLPQKPTKIQETPASHSNPHSEFQVNKLLFLDSIGIDLFSLLATHPPIISASTADIKAVVEFLQSAAGLNSHDIRRVVSMCPEVLTSKVSSLVTVVTFLLREAGVNGSDLRRIIHRRPRLLASSVETQLRPTLYFLQSIGIEETNKHTSLLSCSVENKFIPRIEFFQKIGFSYRETISMFRRFPCLFCYSIEENLRPKLDYLMLEMGRELGELKEFPHYFSFSLEGRIKPRHRQCLEKGVFLLLPAMLKSSDRRFQDILDTCCSSSAPVRTSPLWSINYDDHNVL